MTASYGGWGWGVEGGRGGRGYIKCRAGADFSRTSDNDAESGYIYQGLHCSGLLGN
jgi:hypothetical protein